MPRRSLQIIAYYTAVSIPLLLIVYILVTGFCWFALSAPVPKQPPAPKSLTHDMIVGTWEYSWASHLDGVISFNDDGSYAAQHDPGSDLMFVGKWKVNGNVVTITECIYRLSTGQQIGGPTDYAFAFDLTGYPKALSGLSNGTVAVALKNPRR